ncbi:MAG: Carbon monoxide dehydrogenase small chain [Planctomycetota bacterium]|jgi:xanthine dehydrogenase YagT iron-sulfur-binding subunit
MRENSANPNPSNRRDFLRGSGMAAATAVITQSTQVGMDEAQAELLATQEITVASGTLDVTLQVNGKTMKAAAEPRSTLLDVLRHRLDVTGPKRVCDRASCGACTVLIDGQAVYSCTTLAIAAQGKEIRTLESFDTGPSGVPHAFHQNDGLMCGYCTPGFVTACQALLEKNPNPTLEEVQKGLDGNICRCGTYVGVVKAALEAAKAIKV